jgi:hypothetical protein
MYLLHFLAHNGVILYTHLFMFFFRNFDKIEFFFYKLKGGDPKEYHIKKSADFMSQEPGSFDSILLLSCGEILLKLMGYSNHNLELNTKQFHILFMDMFLYRRKDLENAFLFAAIRDGKTFLDYATGIEVFRKDRFIRRYSQAAYDTVINAKTIMELRESLKAISSAPDPF